MSVINPIQLIYGEAATAATQNLTSTTPTLLASIVSPALPAGQYLVWFSGSFNSPSAGATITAQLFNNTVADANTLMTISPFDGGTLSATSATGMLCFNCLITVASGTTFEVRAARSAGTAVAGVRSMTWLKVA